MRPLLSCIYFPPWHRDACHIYTKNKNGKGAHTQLADALAYLRGLFLKSDVFLSQASNFRSQTFKSSGHCRSASLISCAFSAVQHWCFHTQAYPLYFCHAILHRNAKHYSSAAVFWQHDWHAALLLPGPCWVKCQPQILEEGRGKGGRGAAPLKQDNRSNSQSHCLLKRNHEIFDYTCLQINHRE